MRELNITRTTIHAAALDQALKIALGEKCLGVSTYGTDRPISIWLDESATNDDCAAADAIASAHNPVFLSADKTHSVADGGDTATITVLAQNPVNLLIGGTSVPVTLVDGVGTMQIVSNDPAKITITVENPENRSTITYLSKAPTNVATWRGFYSHE